MITKRDMTVAVVTLCVTMSIVVLAHSQQTLMRSSVFDWNSIESKPTKVGSMRSFFRSPTTTLSELECHATTVNPGEAPHQPHKHADEELIIIKEGTVEAFTGDLTKLVGPGSVIFAASNQMHGLRNVGRSQATYFVIRWSALGAVKRELKETGELDN